jgi:hypothetical protein
MLLPLCRRHRGLKYAAGGRGGVRKTALLLVADFVQRPQASQNNAESAFDGGVEARFDANIAVEWQRSELQGSSGIARTDMLLAFYRPPTGT